MQTSVSSISATAKRFTENWLQALTGSVASPAARQVRPLLTDIDSISQTRETAEQHGAAERVWQFISDNDLVPLAMLCPTNSEQWDFDGEDKFAFARPSKLIKPVETFEQWAQALGLQTSEFDVIGTITSAEWSDLMRSEAVRQRRGMTVPNTVGHTLHLPARAKWANSTWTITFAQTDWIQRTSDLAFQTDRYEQKQIDEVALQCAEVAVGAILKTTLPSTQVSSDREWMYSVTKLSTLHQSVMTNYNDPKSVWFRKVWCAVWPVIYREQNVLNQPCDLIQLKADLADCFKTVPKLTVWMFVYAKLVCSSSMSGGLGVCGRFRRS